MESIINKHNKKVTNADNDTSTVNQVQCNCRNKDRCPLDNKCLTSSVIYNAHVYGGPKGPTQTKKENANKKEHISKEIKKTQTK